MSAFSTLAPPPASRASSQAATAVTHCAFNSIAGQPVYDQWEGSMVAVSELSTWDLGA